MISIETLKTELATIRDNIKKTSESIQQATANLNALAGAEQILMKLIESSKANLDKNDQAI